MLDMAAAAGLARAATDRASWLALMIAPPLLRVALAVPFLRSGLTKWDGLVSLSPAAVYLFEDEFKLHILGQLYDLPSPDLLALVDSVAEVVLPVFLIVGLATRFSALGLLGMTAVIQLVVPDGWANFHLPWAALSLAIVALGPGPLSLDWVIERYFRRAMSAGAA
jgi:putative oxidoreductase